MTMKHLFLVAIIVGLGILTKAQTEYEVSSDGTGKILKGLITRDMLEKDTAFKWFHEKQAGYTPNTETVSVLKAKGPQVQFVVFGGTWCEDTQNLLPKFYSLMDAASFPSDQVRVIMVDRHKKSVNHLPEDMHLASTPTFIVLKDGKEIGRVVEYGKSGQWDKEIGDIVSQH
ncbi:MAG TPA: thioredoxin family protein [Puia sp.]|jgi:thiol-disulfide isomerase/thioredoxin|nr:thioredoxin family protein [Puia sp.]